MSGTARLNVDLGESPDEDPALFALADLANIACGGHAGDAATMALAVERCAAAGTEVGAHPSYPDRPGFGRRTIPSTPAEIRRFVAEQCAALRAVCAHVGHVKPHGALYHDAADPSVAAAILDGVLDALGPVAVIGPPVLLELARARGLTAWSEGFADRGTRPDGSLIPRGRPGDLVTEPAAAAARARTLAAEVDTICVHADTPGAAAIARAVREALGREPMPAAWQPFGDAAFRADLPHGVDRGRALAELLARPGVVDVVLADAHAAVWFRPQALPDLADFHWTFGRSTPARTHEVAVRFDGPDLDSSARALGLDAEGLAQSLCALPLEVRFLGFLPGFAYLGELPPPLRLPRRSTPRSVVPAGSFAIAAHYAGIYPTSSPGGWHLLGTAAPPAIGAWVPGDRVRLRPDGGA